MSRRLLLPPVCPLDVTLPLLLPRLQFLIACSMQKLNSIHLICWILQPIKSWRRGRPGMLPNVTAQDPPTCYPTLLHKIPQHVTQRYCTRSPNMLPNVTAQDSPTCYPTLLHKIPQHVTQHHCTSPPGLPFLYLHIRSDQIFKVMRRQCSTFNRADSHEEVNQLLP